MNPGSISIGRASVPISDVLEDKAMLPSTMCRFIDALFYDESNPSTTSVLVFLQRTRYGTVDPFVRMTDNLEKNISNCGLSNAEVWR